MVVVLEYDVRGGLKLHWAAHAPNHFEHEGVVYHHGLKALLQAGREADLHELTASDEIDERWRARVPPCPACLL
jgi:hypothetical protein